MAATLCDAFAVTLGQVADTLDAETVEAIRQRLFDIAGAVAVGQPGSGARSYSLPGEGLLDEIAKISAAARASEADDIHIGCCVTAGAAVVPVALALAAATGTGDSHTARAIVVGYEAAVRLGLAIDGAHRVYSGIWPSFFVAPVAAAAAAAYLLSPDVTTLSQAIAIAATRVSGGSWLPPEPSARWLAFGSAVAEGVRCGAMAHAGLRGDTGFLEVGLVRTLRVEADFRHLTAVAPPAILATDIKPFATARQLLSAIEAAREAHAAAEHQEPDRIVVALPAQYRPMVDRPSPAPGLELASAQLQVATALAMPELLASPHRAQAAEDARVARIASRVVVVEDAVLTAMYPRHWPAVVEIEVGGRRFTAQVEDPLGTPSRPLGWAGLRGKLSAMIDRGDDLPRLEGFAKSFCRSGTNGVTALYEWMAQNVAR